MAFRLVHKRVSVVQILRGIAELLLRSLRVPRRRVQVFVPEDLSQTHEIILIIGQELVGHRVPQEMRMNLVPADRRVFVAEVLHATISERATLADKYLF